ncbi:MAG: tetratricopeptide repeat protein [Streptosporangiaceae bacterium]|nr:tetratricopeptide repeat protein [Streptosporangiaceae bacterium]
MVEQQSGTPQLPIVLSGTVPPLAEYYYPRPETGPDLAATMAPGQTVVLVHGEETEAAAAQGGTGKTQLAVQFAHAVWQGRTAEVLVWVTGSSAESVTSGFALAATTVDGSNPGESADDAAARFLAWLTRTRRPWALVIDDVIDLADLGALWSVLPSSGSGSAGRVLITSRLPAASFEGKDVSVIAVPGLSRREALAYLSSRLTDHPDQRIEALDLAEELDRLPLVLAQATAVISARRQSCREYRGLFAERRKHMPAIPGASAPVLAAWSIAVECAHELPPAGLAWPTLVLAAMMDYHGVPGAVLTSPAACSYVTGRPSTAGGADQTAVRGAISNLAAAGLVSIDPGSAVRTVSMHASVAAAVRAWLPQTDLEHVVLSAADALLQTWPETDGGPQLEQALRDCTTALQSGDGALLWKTEAHPLLFRTGLSLENSGLFRAAITYWQSLLSTSTRLLGPGHANSVVARDRLAAAYEAAGLFTEATAVFQAALADRERNQGPEHADTIAARAQLAHAYVSAGRADDAVALYERAVADAERVCGPGHPVTLGARASLAQAYATAGKTSDAISAYDRVLGDSERALGSGHPTTLSARASLAGAYLASGRAKDAIAQLQRALADRERMRGGDHPDTIAARASLASAYRAAGKLKDAIAAYQRVLADRERIEGADHPDTIAARANLAYAYRSAGRLREAIPHYERTLVDRERVQGRDHRDTLIARSNLAACYQQARRLTDAVPQYERALKDSERMLGPGDIETLTTRCNLASAYYTAGRLSDVVVVLQRALTDCERYLGPDHQMTQTVRENLDAATQI